VGQLSPLAVGDTTDGDPDNDRIGVIATASGDIPIVLERSTNRVPVRWRVSAPTVARIDSIYPTLGAPWMRDRIPATLMREGPLHVFLWQWLGLAIAIPLLMLLAYVLGELLRSVLLRVVLRTEAQWDDQLLDGLRRPFRLMVVALGLTPIVELLQINVRVASFINAAARGLVLIAIFWGLLRLIRIAQRRMEANAFEHGQVQARTLIPLLGNFLRVTLVIVAMLVALAQFGYPVGTLLTGLGIGGIAIALAAQKTVEHLFGSVSLAADKAFRVGDWVRAGTTEGAVERIGLRSTSFRTNERTVVRIPNGKLADERIETFGERDRMLMRTELDLTYETTPSQLDTIRDELEATLRAHSKIWAETVMVHVVAFTESSIRIKVMAWFETTNHPEFLRIRHEMYLEFMRIIERNGSSFAFPTRTLHVVGDQQAIAQTPFKGAVAPGDDAGAPRDVEDSDARVGDDGDSKT
jgi:MscS family membrane protein